MAHSRDATWHYRNHGAGFDLRTAQPGQTRLLDCSSRLRAWKRWLPPYLPEPLRTAGGIATERSNMVDGMSFEGFFNAVFRSMAEHGFGNPGRTAMNAGSFNAGELGVLPLRAFQMGVAYLVSEDELPRSYNDRASALATAADAHALLEEIQRAAAGKILTAG